MINSKILCVGLAVSHLFLFKTKSEDGYSISVSPQTTVADGTSGEEVHITWDTPFGAITIADFINIHRQVTNGISVEWNLEWLKQEIFRDNDSQYIFAHPGYYKVSYLHFAFFNSEEKANAFVTVSPVLSLVPHAKNYPPKRDTVVIFGDSLTEGVGSTSSNIVDWLISYTDLPIINAGRSGDTTGDALERIDRDVLAHNPGVAVVILGGNDLLDQLPISQTASNLAAIVQKIQNTGAITVVVGVRGGIFIDRYREMYHELYTSTRSIFIPDILKNIPENPFLIGEALHPNEQGYRRMALRIAPVLNALFPNRTNAVTDITLTMSSPTRLGITCPLGTYELLCSGTVNTPIKDWRVLNTLTMTNTTGMVDITPSPTQEFFFLRRK